MAKERIDPTALRTAIAVVIGGVAIILDSTIVSVALKQLSVDLHTGIDTIQWVSTGYLLALGVVMPVVGWLQGRFGAKSLWIAGQVVFLLGSVLCATAWNAQSLIAFRVLQGLGGGVMMPLMTTMIIQSASASDRVRLMAAVSLPSAVGPILGPVVGGLVLGAGSWRWLFLINVPLCVAGLRCAQTMIPADGTRNRTRLDVVGLSLLSPALVALLYGLSNIGPATSISSPKVCVPLAVGVVLLLAFVFWSLHQRGAAIVDLAVLRSRPTSAASVMLFLTGAALYGAMLLLPLYWQDLRGQDALGAGLLLIPQGVGSLLSRTVATRLMDRLSSRAVAMIGFVLVAVATVPFTAADAHTSYWLLLGALLLRGLGLGMVVIPLMTVAFLGLERDQVPNASIITRIAQQVGGSIGTALLAVVLADRTQAHGSLAGGFDDAFWWAFGLTALAVLIAFALPGRPKREAEPTASHEGVSAAVAARGN